MNAELIAVGTELLLGDTINTDAAAVARLLSELGINVYWQTVVGDNRARLEQAVQLARTRAALIITTGGLGPTCDDLTKEVVAGAFGIPLELNKAEEERLRGLYRERHTYMTENHLQQVMLPRGCTVLQNDWGTAPACAFEADGCLVIMLPGPPLECEPLLRYRVRPLLAARGDGIIVSHSVKIFGIGEGTMEYQLRDLMNEMQNPTLAPYAKEGECLVRVTAKAATEAEAETMIAPCLARVQRELGAFAYGVDTLSSCSRSTRPLPWPTAAPAACSATCSRMCRVRRPCLPAASSPITTRPRPACWMSTPRSSRAAAPSAPRSRPRWPSMCAPLSARTSA